jgi:hypothetical protein
MVERLPFGIRKVINTIDNSITSQAITIFERIVEEKKKLK